MEKERELDAERKRAHEYMAKYEHLQKRQKELEDAGALAAAQVAAAEAKVEGVKEELHKTELQHLQEKVEHLIEAKAEGEKQAKQTGMLMGVLRLCCKSRPLFC